MENHNNQTLSVFILLLSLIAIILGSCELPAPETPPESTFTPSPSATCETNYTFETPSNWEKPSKFFLILFDPDIGSELGYEDVNGLIETDFLKFLERILPKVLDSGDAYSILRMGVRNYENALVKQAKSEIDTPPAINPSPTHPETLTPIFTPDPGKPDLERFVEQTAYVLNSTEHVAIGTETARANNCERIAHGEVFGITATVWEATVIDEDNRVSTEISSAATEYWTDIDITVTPFESRTIYEGLSHATIDFDEFCDSFDECVLIVVDDLVSWQTLTVPGQRIDLSGVKVMAIMPNCVVIQQPSCKSLQDFWDIEFKRFGVTHEIFYANGQDLEQKILEFAK